MASMAARGDLVDSIVTSPPYADQRDYERAAAGEFVTYAMTRSSSRAQRSAAPDQFVDDFMPALEAMQAVLEPTGSLMLNLGVVMRDGEESGYADEILRRARAMGWKLLQRIVWHKPNSLPLSHPAYMHIKHEFVFWLALDVKAYRGYDRDTRVPHSQLTLDRFDRGYQAHTEKRGDQRYRDRDASFAPHPDGGRPPSVTTHAVGGRSVDHPAIMPIGLATYLVSLSCRAGGRVLDPYCGAGTTGIAALRRDRSFLGIEIHEPYCELAREQIRSDAPLFNVDGEGWRCEGCGAREGRYDNGAACEKCVMLSFAESG